jgi:choline trimethylamine-lyase
MQEPRTNQIAADSKSRINKLREGMLGPPCICIERGRIITKSYKETEGEAAPIRRAKALKKILSEMTVYIDNGELIVGRTTSKQRGCFLMPEIQWEWYLRELDIFSTRDYDRCTPLLEKEKAQMREFLPYWKGKCTWDKYMAAVPADVLKLSHKVFLTNTSSLSGVHFGHIVVDYNGVITQGLNALKTRISANLAKLNLTDLKDFEKYQFYRASEIALDAAIHFAQRYAKLARSLAENEPDTVRKAELNRIAEICDWVPANPARSFYEALQSIWFIRTVLTIEAWGPGIGFGRPDQYLYPYYKKDLEAGKITPSEAQELLALLLIKSNDLAALMSTGVLEFLAGFPTLVNITLGGVTSEGQDAVNDLTYLFLEAEKDVRLTAEEFVIRVNRNNPEGFLIKACEVAKSLKGKIKFISDNTAIRQLMNDGKPVEYARDYVVVGCFMPTVPVNSMDVTGGSINLGYILDLALNNGAARLTGEQNGPETGDPKKFKSYEDVWKAYKTQVEALIPKAIISRNIDRQIYADNAPCPFQSSLFPACLVKGIDINNGGTYPYATESHGAAGAPNVGDSLAAIKKVVFEDKNISMERLIEALDKNFEGYEDVLFLLKKAPKFGNDDDYVDSIVNDVLVHISCVISQFTGIAGTRPNVAAAAGTGYLSMGKVVGALPDSRKAGEPLSEGGISPHQGRNINGPTATLRSVAKLDHVKISGGSVLNMRFNPDTLRDEAKIRQFATMIRTYCETGGYHVQFNIIGAETLRDAQKHPDQYRDLLVRVATYSAYFVDLSPRVQNDIISRTEFQEI